MGLKMNTKIAKSLINIADIVYLSFAIIFLLSDFSGLLELIFPEINKELIYQLTLGFGILLYASQKVFSSWYRPNLIIVNSDWEKTGNDDRLFVTIENSPKIFSEKGKSEETLAEISIYEYKSLDQIDEIVVFRDVRWQGTPPPQKGDPDRQAYDNRRVDISVGDQRKLYFISRYHNQVYYHNDESYSSYNKAIVNWKNQDQRLDNNSSYVICLKISSKDHDPIEFWFEFRDFDLNSLSSKTKVIKEIEKQYRR